jgi:2-haloacid dehalogenase
MRDKPRDKWSDPFYNERGLTTSSISSKATMAQPLLKDIRICIFDAYGTLFDTRSVTLVLQEKLGALAQPLAEMWRNKQLQYTWLRGLAGHHADFWQVTGDALDFSLEALSIREPGLRSQLMESYLRIDAYPDVPPTLQALQSAGIRMGILSNGTPHMLEAAVSNARIVHFLEAILSVESVGVYKPHPEVYRLVEAKLGVAPQNVCFISSNGWDAYSASAFGFQTLWCNRFRQPHERIPSPPAGILHDLTELPASLGIPSA